MQWWRQFEGLAIHEYGQETGSQDLECSSGHTDQVNNKKLRFLISGECLLCQWWFPCFYWQNQNKILSTQSNVFRQTSFDSRSLPETARIIFNREQWRSWFRISVNNQSWIDDYYGQYCNTAKVPLTYWWWYNTRYLKAINTRIFCFEKVIFQNIKKIWWRL